MLLAVDIGNSNTSIGLHQHQGWQRIHCMRTGRAETPDEVVCLLRNFFPYLEKGDLEGVVLSSVVPHLKGTFEVALGEYLGVTPFW